VVGFISFVNHIDVPGSNKMADILEDEEVFVSSIAPCIGAVVGVVVCESEEAARIASKLIDIEYELLKPTIFTIEDAIANESYFGNELCFQQGDVDKSLADAENIIEGTVLIGGQEHFYLETNCCIVIPSDEDKELQLHLGTQNLTAAQELIALVLGRDASRISCHVKRMGGAFGGKETRP
jgi:xanthine dehydrogenase/oxidase